MKGIRHDEDADHRLAPGEAGSSRDGREGPTPLHGPPQEQISMEPAPHAPEPQPPRPLTRTDVLSTTEVAEVLGIPRSTVPHLARRGDLPARRVGRRWIFLGDRVAAALVPLDKSPAEDAEREY